MTSTTTITTFFTSGSGSPASGLSPSIVIRNVTTTALVLTGTMTEVGNGWYKFPFTEYTGSVDYAITIDGGSSVLDNRYSFAGNENYVDDIWDAPRSDHQISGSMAQALNDVYDIEVGSWRILSNGQMVLLRSGSGDEIARFNLQDISGINITDPTTEDPFRRNRV